MTMTTTISNDYVEMRFGPRWTYISCVRKFVASFFMIGLADKERAEQISMAASWFGIASRKESHAATETSAAICRGFGTRFPLLLMSSK